MRVLPRTQAETVQWVSARIEPWTEQASTLGLDAEQVTSLTETLSEVQSTFAELQAAKVALQQAQLAFDQKYQELRKKASASIQTIRAKAQATTNPVLFAEASIPPPSKSTTVGQPPAPSELKGRLTNDGFIVLDWKASLHRSPYFTIYRQLPGETRFTLLGTAGTRRFYDSSLPAGTTHVAYRVIAHRGKKSSESSETLQILLGVPRQQMAA